MLDESHKHTLVKLAAASVRYGLDNHDPLPVIINDFPPDLQEIRASFVTLQLNQQLRGCIGTLEAYRPLVKDVVDNAFAAAFRDPRFNPVQSSEYDLLHFHISVLNPAQPMSFISEEDLIQQIRPGVDGLILEDMGRRGTFLPSVWESLPETADFWTHLKQKAGLSTSHWSDSLKVSRYTVEEFG